MWIRRTRAPCASSSRGDDFVSDEIWDAEHKVEWLETGVPGCRIESSCKSGHYRLTKEIIPDPMRDGLFVRGRFLPAQQNLRLYLVIDAHIGDRGANNEAWAGEYKGEPMVFAQRGPVCFACGELAAPAAMQRRLYRQIRRLHRSAARRSAARCQLRARRQRRPDHGDRLQVRRRWQLPHLACRRRGLGGSGPAGARRTARRLRYGACSLHSAVARAPGAGSATLSISPATRSTCIA